MIVHEKETKRFEVDEQYGSMFEPRKLTDVFGRPSSYFVITTGMQLPGAYNKIRVIGVARALR